MEGKEKFLFYYSLLAITILFFTSVFFAPKPQNFISLALLIPLLLYFWVKATSPGSTAPNLWSIRLLAVLFVLSALGVFSYSLGGSREIPQEEIATENISQDELNKKELQELVTKISALNEEDSNEEIKQELADIKRQLARITNNKSVDVPVGGSETGTLGQTTDVENISKLLAEVPYGFVTIKDENLSELDVLDNSSFSSKRVGLMQKGQKYEFFEKTDGWYLIKLPDGSQGWVNQRDIKEVYQ